MAWVEGLLVFYYAQAEFSFYETQDVQAALLNLNQELVAYCL